MDVTIDQASLSRALRLVTRVVPAKAALPILQTVLLEGRSGRLALTATDAQIGLVTTLGAEVRTAGRLAVPARLLGDYVAQLPPDALRLTRDADTTPARVECARFTAHLATLDPDDFPRLPEIDEAQALDLAADRLREAIGRVVFAAARDDSRPALSSVLVELSADGLTLAAADGFRMARARLGEVAGPDRQLLVPARAVAELGRLLADAEGVRLTLTRDGRGASFAAGATTLLARLTEGRFPDVERVIPREWRTRVTVDADALRQAVRVAGIFGGGGDARPVVLETAPDRLRLRARGDETGEAESELPATLEGEEQAIALNTRLLTDLLDALPGPRLELSWTMPQAPVVIREADHAEPADLALVMPLFMPALARGTARAA